MISLLAVANVVGKVVWHLLKATELATLALLTIALLSCGYSTAAVFAATFIGLGIALVDSYEG